MLNLWDTGIQSLDLLSSLMETAPPALGIKLQKLLIISLHSAYDSQLEMQPPFSMSVCRPLIPGV